MYLTTFAYSFLAQKESYIFIVHCQNSGANTLSHTRFCITKKENCVSKDSKLLNNISHQLFNPPLSK